MTDKYIRIQDTIDEINSQANTMELNGGIPYAQGARAMAIVIEQMPPADVAPVVRCKDCRYHALFHTCSHPDGMKCVSDNSFCSYGKHREEQKDEKIYRT